MSVYIQIILFTLESWSLANCYFYLTQFPNLEDQAGEKLLYDDLVKKLTHLFGWGFIKIQWDNFMVKYVYLVKLAATNGAFNTIANYIFFFI